MIIRRKVTIGFLASVLACGLAGLFAPGAEAGQFRRGLGRGESLKVRRPILPAVRIGVSLLAIDVRDASVPAAPAQTADPFGFNQQPAPVVSAAVPISLLNAALDEVFRDSFTLVQANGDALLRVAVIHYTPAESSIRTLQQKVRAPGTDPNTGQPTTVEQTIPVEQWAARGQVALRVELVDKTGVLLDAFTPQASVSAQQVISANGQDQVDRTQIPTSDQILAKLVSDLAVQFRPRYAPGMEEIEIPLAVDDELRAGNELARKGDYPAASKAWEAAETSKSPGDRVHNLGSVYEAQAYAMLARQVEPGEVRAYLQTAAKQYADAAKADPKEKYIERAEERVAQALKQVDQWAERERTRQRMLTAKTQPSPWPPGAQQQAAANAFAQPFQAPVFDASATQPQPAAAPATAFAPAPDSAAQEALQQALNDTRGDTAQEAQFRQFVRLRMHALSGPADDALRTQLEATGPTAYSLTALGARRVVHQEAQAWATLAPKFITYRDTFTAFAGDGRISTEERTTLRALATNLALGEDDRRGIEAATRVAE